MAHYCPCRHTFYKCSRSIIDRTMVSPFAHTTIKQLNVIFCNCNIGNYFPWILNTETAPNGAHHCPKTSYWCPNNVRICHGLPVEHFETDKNDIFIATNVIFLVMLENYTLFSWQCLVTNVILLELPNKICPTIAQWPSVDVS